MWLYLGFDWRFKVKYVKINRYIFECAVYMFRTFCSALLRIHTHKYYQNLVVNAKCEKEQRAKYMVNLDFRCIHIVEYKSDINVKIFVIVVE